MKSFCDGVNCEMRVSREEYAARICKDFFAYPEGSRGLPAMYSEERPDKACRIYCKGPEDLRWSPTEGGQLPDGTWCHKDIDKGKDYFCLDGVCRPDDQEEQEDGKRAVFVMEATN